MFMPTFRIRAVLGPVLIAAGLLAGACTPEPPAQKAAVEEPAVEKPATEVAWKTYEAGLAEAKAKNKPVCLIFYTDWCPHCKNYHKVFDDPALIQLSQKFVMIRINKDQDPATSAKYAPDGDYIPRTYFLKSDGTLLESITEQRDKYRYFYDEHDPAAVMRSMNAVLALPPA